MWEFHNTRQDSLATGWKLHISCTPQDLAGVKSKVSVVMGNHTDVAWKSVKNMEEYLRINGVNTPRENAGKVFTIYPNTKKQMVELAFELERALNCFAQGPRILTDYRLRSSQVHARFGAFKEYYSIDYNGDAQPSYRNSETNTVTVDNRVINPDEKLSPFAAYNDVPEASNSEEKFDYSVIGALKFANGGGVYLAEKDGERFVLKEGRPFAAYDDQGDDAVTRIRREYRILQQCKDLQEVVSPVELFRYQGNWFLVERYVAGQTLTDYVVQNGIDLWGLYLDNASRESYLAKARGLFARIRKAMDEIHRRGVYHGDLSSDNIIVVDDQTINIIDFGSGSDSDTYPVNSIHATAIDIKRAHSNLQIDNEFIRKIKEYLIWPESKHYVYARSYIFDMLHDLQTRDLCEDSLADDVSTYLPSAKGDLERESRRHALQASSIDETMQAIQRKTGRLWSTFDDRLEVDTDFLSGAFGTACLLSHNHKIDPASRNQADEYVNKCNRLVDKLLKCNGLGVSFTDGILGVIVAETIIGNSMMKQKAVQYAEALFSHATNVPADRLTKELLLLSLVRFSGYIKQSASLSECIVDNFLNACRSVDFSSLGIHTRLMLILLQAEYKQLIDKAFIDVTVQEATDQLILISAGGYAIKKECKYSTRYDPYIMGSAGLMFLLSQVERLVPKNITTKIEDVLHSWELSSYYGDNCFLAGRTGVILAKLESGHLLRNELLSQTKLIYQGLQLNEYSVWPADKIGIVTSLGWGFGSGLLLQHVLARHSEPKNRAK